ncbi:alpha-amlyase [Corallincola holothuriorum]|uniref:Alpha-amylase n=1 Tax=Corallincola holothuriorum TaxID=2282215 RepID=A0A368NH73_9GAMM|nr:alpha-amylase family glycosyl hydrolase [Corallincola holothuriorum]RCU49808.1 alpha-amlyase [Corallincola holothuriorum]
MNLIRRMLPLAVAMAVATPTLAAVSENNDDIMIQGFHWHSASAGDWYQQVGHQANELASAGFDMVWLPPASQAGSLEGYLPEQYNNLNSNYGTEQDLRDLITTLHGKNIKAIADIVINHRNGTGSWCNFVNPDWGNDAITSDDEAWDATGSDCSGTRGAADSGGGYAAARDIDHSQWYVRQSLKTWMNDVLKGVGFDGWRYDYVKGYWGGYNGEYNEATSPYFSVGEYWTSLCYNGEDCFFGGEYPDQHRQLQLDWVDSTNGNSAVFDFTTKGILNKVLETYNFSHLRDGNGKPQGTIGAWPSRSVTFVDNHDTGPSEMCGNGQSHWPVPCDKVMQAYAYILTHPGVPSIYWAHYFDWGLGDDIKALMALRKAEGLHSDSSVTIDRAEQGLYAAYIGDTVAMKMGNGSWSPAGGNWTLAEAGTDWAIWTKSELPGDWKRTVILIEGLTESGQDMFIRGGIDHDYAAANLGRSCTATNFECAMPIRHNNLRNATTAPWKANDNYLDWYGPEASQSGAAEGSAADWTTNTWPADWGAVKTVAVDGFGEEPLNAYGAHYWMLDVDMDCSKAVDGTWFELKTFISNGPAWEADVSQAGAPYVSGNHFAECGKVNVFKRGESEPVSIHNF